MRFSGRVAGSGPVPTDAGGPACKTRAAYDDGMREITVEELAEHTDRPLIDVREPDEFASGHVPRAINIPLGQLADRVDEVPEGPVDVICHLGGRSLRGARILEGAGRAEVTSVAGGTDAWQDSGRPLDS